MQEINIYDWYPPVFVSQSRDREYVDTQHEYKRSRYV